MTRRVAIVTHQFKGGGGVTTMTRFLHRALKASGRFEPEIISLALSSDDEASVRLRLPASWKQGVRCVRQDFAGIPFLHVGAWFAEFEFQRHRPRRVLTELLERYDIIQFVTGIPPWLCAAAPVRKPRCLWMATVTRADRATRIGAVSAARRWPLVLMTFLAERMERRALGLADEIFALSDYTLRNVRRLTGNNRGRLAYCGVDTNLFYPPEKPGAGGILCVGRLDDPRKNIPLLLRAYGRVTREAPAAPELWLVGPPLNPAASRLIHEQGLESRVRLLGPKSPEELAEIYRQATLFVLASDEEGLGIVLLEAMASGLAVVSTACGGPESIVRHGENGFLVPVGDEPALAKAIQQLLINPGLRQQMGDTARRGVVERFSISAAGKVFTDCYDELPLQ